MHKAIRKISFLFLMGLWSTVILAGGGNNKSTQLKGKVVDNQGNPIVGAKIELIDSKQTFYTDFDGEFTMVTSTSDKKEIEVSYISFESQKIELDAEDISNSSLILQLYSK